MREPERRPILRSARLYLRPAERDDVPTFVEWLSDAEVGEGLANRAPWSLVAEERWFDELQRVQGKSVWHFVICLREGGRPIGFAALESIDHANGSTELGLGIGEHSEWDRGYGTEAVGVLLDFAFGELRLHRVFLHVFDFNERAIHVYEQAGFRLEGTKREAFYRHGRYHGVHVMGILRHEWEVRAETPTWERE
ncbi:MAG: GNAT family protein [Chloroflexota bacterium]|jgi:RimJ/RimL family protein N-acetyltransferase